MEDKELISEFCKRYGKKNFKIRNSFGVKDAYDIIRKEGWKDIGKPVHLPLYRKVIRMVNNLLAAEVANGRRITFPCRMGYIELMKNKGEARMDGDKLRVTYPVDWKSTMKLWCEDAEARNEKILVRYENKEFFKIRYNKYAANYNNQEFYQFEPNRFLKLVLRDNINKGVIDSLW